jgi:hypothetical protein
MVSSSVSARARALADLWVIGDISVASYRATIGLATPSASE